MISTSSNISAISEHRKLELIKQMHLIMINLPQAIKGHQALVQELLNRIEVITKKPDEYKYCVDTLTILIKKSAGQEIQVFFKGKKLTKEVLARDFGIFLSNKNKD